jgi:hypothetical protein
MHVVISGPYTKGSVKNGRKEVLESPTDDEITMRGYKILTSAECTTIMIAELAVTRVWDPLLIRWIGWRWDDFGQDFMRLM